jgi:hypothetical protein
MSKAISSRWPLTGENRVPSKSGPCGICGGQRGAGVGFYPSSLVLPCCILSIKRPPLWHIDRYSSNRLCINYMK